MPHGRNFRPEPRKPKAHARAHRDCRSGRVARPCSSAARETSPLELNRVALRLARTTCRTFAATLPSAVWHSAHHRHPHQEHPDSRGWGPSPPRRSQHSRVAQHRHLARRARHHDCPRNVRAFLHALPCGTRPAAPTRAQLANSSAAREQTACSVRLPCSRAHGHLPALRTADIYVSVASSASPGSFAVAPPLARGTPRFACQPALPPLPFSRPRASEPLSQPLRLPVGGA